MDFLSFCCLVIFVPAAGAIIPIIGTEGEAVHLTLPLAVGLKANMIDWRYKKQQTETRIASFAHGKITTDDDIQFNTRLVLNTTVIFLEIKPLLLQDTGLYVVELKLQNKSKVFQLFNLTVYAKISSTLLKKKTESSCVSEESVQLQRKSNCSFVLECSVQKGNHIAFLWQKNGRNVTRWISDCSPYSDNCSVLEVPIDESCSSNYSCTASNAVSTETNYIVPCQTDQQKTRNRAGLIIGLTLTLVLGVPYLLYCRRKKKGEKSKGMCLDVQSSGSGRVTT